MARALDARRDQRVEPPSFDPVRESTTAMLNPRGLAEYSPQLADAVGRVVDGGEFAVVVGGDCSILLGCTLALRRRGRYGLLFLDGHADFHTPHQSLTGEAADMDLALVSGRGPYMVVNLEGRKPYVLLQAFRSEAPKQTRLMARAPFQECRHLVFLPDVVAKDAQKKSVTLNPGGTGPADFTAQLFTSPVTRAHLSSSESCSYFLPMATP